MTEVDFSNNSFSEIHESIVSLCVKKENSRKWRNGHLFQPVTCLYGQLSVTLSQFYYLFDSCITVSAQGQCQPFCTPKWPLTAKAMWTDGWSNHLPERLCSLFIAICSHTWYLHVDRRHTLWKQSPRRYFLPVAPSVRRCVIKSARYRCLATRVTSFGFLLVHTEPWANGDSLSIGKLIKRKPLIPHVLLSLCLQIPNLINNLKS